MLLVIVVSIASIEAVFMHFGFVHENNLMET